MYHQRQTKYVNANQSLNSTDVVPDSDRLESTVLGVRLGLDSTLVDSTPSLRQTAETMLVLELQ